MLSAPRVPCLIQTLLHADSCTGAFGMLREKGDENALIVPRLVEKLVPNLVVEKVGARQALLGFADVELGGYLLLGMNPDLTLLLIRQWSQPGLEPHVGGIQ